MELLWHLYIRQISFLQVCVSCSGMLKLLPPYFLLNFAILGRNDGVVTYGIGVGSTRDWGFTTDVLITVGVLGVLHLICVFTVIGAFGSVF